MFKSLSGMLSRLISFLLLTSMLAISLYFQHFTPPFSAIPSKSMEPVLEVGDLILIKKITPTSIKVGDIIVVNVPTPIRDKYHFPASVVHRVTKVDKSSDNLTFRMKGDNNLEEDPFTVLPEDVAGKVRKTIPHLGYVVLFLHSKQGMYFILSAIAIYLVYILMDWFAKKTDNLKKGLSNLFVGELVERTTVIEKKQETQLQIVQQSLEKFSAAIEEYGEHLKSHTASVKGLAEGALELTEAANKQNRILDQLNQILFDSSQPSALDSLSARYSKLPHDSIAPHSDLSDETLAILKNVVKEINTDTKEPSGASTEKESATHKRKEDYQEQSEIQSLKNDLKNMLKELERFNDEQNI
jgi:signal peptidase I